MLPAHLYQRYLQKCTALCVLPTVKKNKFTFADPTDIYLIDLAYQLSVWEDKIHNYNTEHKKSLYHDYQEIERKIHYRLDNIDFDPSKKPNFVTDRRKVYGRLSELKEKFENKIHPGHETCLQCDQVKVVPYNL